MPFAKLFHAASEADLPAVARALAPLCTPGRVIALEGDLGAGKTALARALIRELAGDPALDVPSPTFTLVQTYDAGSLPVWHFDLYRLKSPDEVFELGWEDALARKALILVEWPERLGPYTPAHVTRLTLTPNPDATRTIEVHDD